MHNLENLNGQTSFVSAREDAWHRLGTVLDSSFDAQTALEQANLARWNLRKSPIVTVDEETGDLITVPERFAIIRDNPVIDGQRDALGVVGPLYNIMQNESLTALLDTLVDESGAHYETAGSIDGGRKVFVSMKLPQSVSVGGVDQVDTYLSAMTSHDGSTATTLMITPIRIVCENTLNLALQSSKGTYRVRHTTSAERLLIGQAREALDLTFNYMDEFQETAERLINTTMTQVQFEELIDANYGAPEDAAAQTVTRADNRLQEMSRLFSDAATHEEVRNTAWAGLNALTEWFDHFSPVRGTVGQQEDARARKALLDPAFKNRALSVVSEFAGV